MSARFQIIDIGHRGYSLDRALSELETAVSTCVLVVVLEPSNNSWPRNRRLKAGCARMVYGSGRAVSSCDIWRRL
jgi:hypothetical protein